MPKQFTLEESQLYLYCFRSCHQWRLARNCTGICPYWSWWFVKCRDVCGKWEAQLHHPGFTFGWALNPVHPQKCIPCPNCWFLYWIGWMFPSYQLTQFLGRLTHTMSVVNNKTLVVCGGLYTTDTCISWSKDSPDNVWEFFALLRSHFQWHNILFDSSPCCHLKSLFHFLHVAHQGNFTSSPLRRKAVSYSTKDKILIMGGDYDDARQTGVVLSAGDSISMI